MGLSPTRYAPGVYAFIFLCRVDVVGEIQRVVLDSDDAGGVHGETDRDNRSIIRHVDDEDALSFPNAK